MAALAKVRQFETLRAVLGLVEERGSATLDECAELTEVPVDVLREVLAAALFVDYYTADGTLVSESSCFLLTEDDVVMLTQRHWLRDLDAAPPSPSTALRLLLAGVAVQALVDRSTPHLDSAVTKLRGVVACELRVPVEPPAALAAVRQAIDEGRSLLVRYRSEADDEARDRELLPYRVWSRWGHWYLTARDATEETSKQFRLDRMLSAEVGTTSFEPPTDGRGADLFDLSENDRTVRIRIGENDLESLPAPHELGEPSPVGDGQIELDVTVAGDRRLDHLLVSLPTGAEVVSPEEYKVRRRNHARELLARY